MRTTLPRVLAFALAALVCSSTAAAQVGVTAPEPGDPTSARPGLLSKIRIDQRLNAQVPLDLPFTDETGRQVRLGDYFGRRPVILALVYYECPMLCTQVLNGLVGSLDALTFTAGQEFDVVAISFDAGETPAMAAVKRAAYLKRYGRPGSEAGVHFLTGREDDIRRVTDAVGFHYKYDPAIDQYAHPAVMTILTPEGRVSRYLFGIEFAPVDLRLALVEAADHKIGGVADQMLLFCYHYDPQSGKYGFAITNIVRLGGVLTVFGLGTFILMNLRRERRQASAVTGTATGIR